MYLKNASIDWTKELNKCIEILSYNLEKICMFCKIDVFVMNSQLFVNHLIDLKITELYSL